MHLAYVVDAWPQLTETFILREIAEASRRYRVTIVALGHGPPGPVQPEAQALADRVVHLSDVRTGFSAALLYPIRTVRALRAARRARAESTLRRFTRLVRTARDLRRARVRRIHAHFSLWATAAAEVLSAWTGAPFGFTAHAYDVFRSPCRLEDKARRASWAVACSEATREAIGARCGPSTSGRFVVIRHGVDLAAYRPPEAMREPGPLRILAVGSLVPKKGFDVLLPALARLRERGVRFVVRVVGGGIDGPALLATTERLRLVDAVAFDGPRPATEVRDAMRGWADVLVAPSRVAPDGNRDGLPNVVGEAMACGLPVVGTRVGGIPEMVETGVTGWLVPPADPGSLADALATAEAIVTKDPVRALALSSAARRRAEEVFDAAKNLDAFFEVVERAGRRSGR